VLGPEHPDTVRSRRALEALSTDSGLSSLRSAHNKPCSETPPFTTSSPASCGWACSWPFRNHLVSDRARRWPPATSGDLRLPDLLRGKIADVITRHFPMKTYLINHLGRPESDNPRMRTLVEVVQKAATVSLARHLTHFATS
jgi:hypothetical protein